MINSASAQATERCKRPHRRLLYIAYFFAPAGGAGVQRPLKFAKYLPQFGWHTHVLTVRDGCYFATDPSLNDEIPAHCTVTRTTSWELERLQVLRRYRQRQSQGVAQKASAGGIAGGVSQGLAKLLGRARQCLLPDPQIGWLPFALHAAVQICRHSTIDAVLTTSTPYSAHLVGLLLQQRLGLPWIADFRDAWSHDPMGILAHHRVHAALERRVLRGADHIVGVTDGVVEALRSRGPKRSPPVYHVIANGYDADDFKAAKGSATVKQADTFQITMTGSLYGQMTAVPLYRALEKFLTRLPEARHKLRLSWVGQMDRHAAAEAHRMAERCGLSDVIEHVGYVPHAASIAWLLRSDVLLLILYPGPGAHQIMTGKIFEYLAAQRPILGLAAGTAAGQLIAETQAGLVVHPHHVEAIASAITTLWHKRGEPLPPNPLRQAALERFHRRALTQRLATILDQSTQN